jgi:hypothetical protein
VVFNEGDRLGNVGRSVASQRFGVDKTAPLIRFSATSSPDTTVGAFAFQAEVIDERSGFIDPFFDDNAILRAPNSTANLLLDTDIFGSQHQFASRGAGVHHDDHGPHELHQPEQRDGLHHGQPGGDDQREPFMTAPPCPYRDLPANSISGQLSDGYRSAFAVTSRLTVSTVTRPRVVRPRRQRV